LDVYEAMEKRGSVYKFRSEPISEELLRRIMRAGTLAPSVFNIQPWEFIVVKDIALRESLANLRAKIPKQSEALGTAPVIIVVCYKNDPKMGAEVLASTFACIENMLLAATAEGLGAVTLSFKGEAIKKLLKIPEDVEVATVMPLGYPDEAPVAKSRKTVEEKYHLNVY
jgi:nitroreductase